MNVRLQLELDFMAGCYFENQLHINQYNVSLSLLTQTNDAKATNISVDRIKAFIYGELADTVFFGPQQSELIEMFTMLGINATTLPEEPIDQIIGIMLYCKLNAIMEGRVVVTELDIQSKLGDEVWYLHSEDDALGPFSRDGWWHEANCKHFDFETPPDDKVVKVISAGWTEYNLEWPDIHPQSGNTVVVANFQRDENK